MTSLWQLYRFGYSVAFRTVSGSRLKDLLRLVLEPCNYWRNVEVPAVVNHLRIERGERVLDVGSPKFPSLFIWDRLGGEVWATDIFPYFIEEYSYYKSRLGTVSSAGNYHIEVQDGRKLNYPDSYFDKIYAISVVEHIEHEGDSAALREIARVLKPGGLCCLTVPAARHFSESTTSEQNYYLKPIDGKPVFYQHNYDEEALHRRLIAPSGLKLETVERFGERWVPYERLYEKLPRFIKIPLSLMGPLFSKLFLYRMEPGSEAEPKTFLIVLKKEPARLGKPRDGMA